MKQRFRGARFQEGDQVRLKPWDQLPLDRRGHSYLGISKETWERISSETITIKDVSFSGC